MRKRNNRAKPTPKLDPDFVAISCLTVSSISMLLALSTKISTARSARDAKKRKALGDSVIRSLIGAETRVQQIQTALKALLDKGGTRIDAAEMRFGKATVEFDPATFGFVTQELDRLTNCIRHFQNSLNQAIVAMVRADILPDERTAKELSTLEKLCNSVIWESDTFGEARGKLLTAIEQALTVLRMLRTYAESLREE
jgi:hypothetical protein